MGILDSLGDTARSIFGQNESAAIPAIIAAALEKTSLGGLNGIVAKLQQGGFGDQVASWLGNGANQPITTEQLRAALGNEQVRQIAGHLGLPVDQALDFLAKHLPTTVDQASPNGSL